MHKIREQINYFGDLYYVQYARDKNESKIEFTEKVIVLAKENNYDFIFGADLSFVEFVRPSTSQEKEEHTRLKELGKKSEQRTKICRLLSQLKNLGCTVKASHPTIEIG